MRVKPEIPDELIIALLREEYEIQPDQINFFSSGDSNTAAYYVTIKDRAIYFLKLRKGFNEMIVTVPLFLKSRGIEAIITPLETKSKQYWVDFNDYKMILYPFIEGKNGFEMELSDQHKRKLGAALKAIHSTQLLPELKQHIPKEIYSPQWRQKVKALQVGVEDATFQDSTAAKLGMFLKSRQKEINHIVERAGKLATQLQVKSQEMVLCHSDLHGRNLLITGNDELFILDWDDPILAPKERDLMFIGAGIDPIWKSKEDVAIFYEGYGKAAIDISALAYYRYERVIQDIAEFCVPFLFGNTGVVDREYLYQKFVSNFESGGRVEIARKTDELLMHDASL